METIQKIVDENAVAIMVLGVVAVVAIFGNITSEAAPIVNTICGGIIGYLSKGSK